MWCPRQIWSLLDMIRYAVRDLHGLLLWTEHMIGFTYSQENFRFGDAAFLTVKEKELVAQQVTCIRKHFQSLEVQDAFGVCDEFGIKLKHENVNLGECRGYLLSLRRMLTDSLEKRVFM